MNNSGILNEFIDYSNKNDLNMYGIALQQNGREIASYRWTKDERHPLHSMSKSYVSIAVGIAIDEGYISLSDTVVSFFPDIVLKETNAYLLQMTVRDLLIMASGHSEPVLMGRQREELTNDKWKESEEGDWTIVFLTSLPDHAPGEKFQYDSGCTYMLVRIIESATGKEFLEYITPRLFSPLGIDTPEWERCPRGHVKGGTGLSLRTEESLPFGQMLLQGGVYHDKRIVSENWIQEAAKFQIATDQSGFFYDKSLGYGYQFWVAREGAYRASGAYGQGCFVIPSRNAVICYNAHTGNLQGILEGLWEYLISKL